MIWLLIWIPLCSWFLLPKLSLLPTLVLLDRLVPSFELLQRNALALWYNLPLCEALDRPARLSAYDRYSLFLLIALAYWLALTAFWTGPDLVSELVLCSFALPPMQQQLARYLARLLAIRDQTMRKIASKCVVRAIKSLSWALMHRPALVHSADVLPHIDRAPELTWQILKHGSMTALLLYIKRYSQRSYYTAYKYFYYYQTDQLSQLTQRPSAKEARLQLCQMLDNQRWSEFASAKAFGLAVILFHQGEPEIPQWIAQLNFSVARFIAVLTLTQGLHSWRDEWTALGLLFALVLVQRSELTDYWKTVGIVALSCLLCYGGVDTWFCVLLCAWRPFWFGRALFKFALKRLRFAISCAVPMFWLLASISSPQQRWWQLGLYSFTLGWRSSLGFLALLIFGALSSFDSTHLLVLSSLAALFYVLIAYSQRPIPPQKPKITHVQGFSIIDDYKTS